MAREKKIRPQMKESIPQLFGRNVQKYRKIKKLTQEQLSEKLGISQKHLSIIETGTQFASASLIERICEELEVSPADLFGGSDDEILNEIRKTRKMILDFLANDTSNKLAMLSVESDEIKSLINRKVKPGTSEFEINSPW